MRLVPRLAGPFAVLSLAVAGCGGAQVSVQEAPGGPAQLTVPGDGKALNPAATAEGTAAPTATATAGSTPTPTPGAADQAGTGDSTADSTTGGTAAPGAEGTATTDQPPPAGSGDQQFEDFCAQNPGAC